MTHYRRCTRRHLSHCVCTGSGANKPKQHGWAFFYLTLPIGLTYDSFLSHRCCQTNKTHYSCYHPSNGEKKTSSRAYISLLATEPQQELTLAPTETRCMLMYAEHRRSGGEKPCCPLCRVDWGLTAVRALREDVQPRAQGAGGGRSRGRRGGGRGGGAAAAAVVPVTCRSCGVKVQAAFFRCLVCTPAGAWVSEGGF